MRFFHYTSKAAADCILVEGFRDCADTHGMSIKRTGTSLTDVPKITLLKAPNNCTLLVVDLDVAEAEIAEFELIEEGQEERVYREWLMPASFINVRGSVHLATEDEEDEGKHEWFRRAERLLAQEDSA